jgi:hypothetical protein
MFFCNITFFYQHQTQDEEEFNAKKDPSPRFPGGDREVGGDQKGH